MNKGQLLTMDYVIGIAIFLFVFTICLYVWDNALYKVQQDYLTLELLNTARRASDQLVRTTGNPSSWEGNVSSLSSIGLAVSDRILSQQKFDALAGLNYSSLRYHLGAGSYNIYLKISNASGSVFGEAGVRPAEALVVNIRNIVTLDNNTALLDVSVWSPEAGSVLTPTS